MLLSNSARSSEKGKDKKQDQLCTWTLLAIAGNLQKKLSGLFLDKEGKRECEVRRKTEAGSLLFCSSKGKKSENIKHVAPAQNEPSRGFQELPAPSCPHSSARHLTVDIPGAQAGLEETGDLGCTAATRAVAPWVGNLSRGRLRR